MAAYFAAIGLAYMTLQVTMLSHLIHLFGDPVQAGAATLAGFLLSSGAGSMLVYASGRIPVGTVRCLLLSLILVGLLEMWMGDRVLALAGRFPVEARLFVAVLVIAPLGFLMGMPMPLALMCLQSGSPTLLPWAWGVNGLCLGPGTSPGHGVSYDLWLACRRYGSSVPLFAGDCPIWVVVPGLPSLG